MTRILADLPDSEIKRLDRLAVQQGKSRAAVLREAVSAYRGAPDTNDDLAWLRDGFGAWARLGVTIDREAYERERRADWTRPWDDDYDEVRAESPEHYTEYDDRERAHYLALVAKAAAKRATGNQ